MKIILRLIVAFILIYSCQTEDNKNTFSHISQFNKLELRTRDDKCGEWGGDETQLVIYRDDLKGSLLADYLEKTACYDGSKPKIIKSIKRIKITDEEKKLIIESINELCEKKLNRQDIPSNSGRFNLIMLSDSSMIISDFPSVELKKFKELSQKIKQK
ncbi:hypothetical protein J2X97_001560 [Epilithonimonas hungarica]|uniref:hypothetical protein n=1 Tax=Epilithonimonas hungarica TaxID=454006 RepID=UPI00277F6E2D|nr:hypothetical protein [Epilithonimonas hungarica]MDP9955923.1 hypothetical protein [Epilithonimonas hungarica]